jgi:hypothetical protein
MEPCTIGNSACGMVIPPGGGGNEHRRSEPIGQSASWTGARIRG